MGTSQSIPSTVSRQKVFELTRDTRGMMDVMLEYMLKEISVRDFLALSNPTECKKYVIFLANSLNKHFYELQIVPVKDKKGVIAFRPVKDLIKDDDTEKQTLCLTLAYFYTRIFQIYGALALTVIDDANVISNSGITSVPIGTIRSGISGLVTPGYSSYTSRGGAAIGPPAAALSNFNFLRSFLYDEKDPQKGYLSTYTGEGNNSGKIYFYPKIEEKDEFGRPIVSNIISETKQQKGIFFIAYIGGNRYSQLEGYAKVEGIGGNIKFTFGKFKYYNKKNAVSPETIDLPSDIIPNKTLTIRAERGAKAYIYTIIGSDKNVSDYFTEILSKVVEFLKRSTLNETSTTSSGVTVSETGTTKELSLARIVQNLSRDKPLGHCLARAMQLLQTLPLKGDQGVVSNICKAKFLQYTTTTATGIKTELSRSGIPEPGASLDTSPGLAGLSQLFYDTIKEGTPRVVIGTDPGAGPDRKSSLQLYLEFMKEMGILFEGGKEFLKKSDDDIVKAGLVGIRNKRDNEWCRGISGDIILPANKAGNVYSFVNQLYKIQLNHAAECGKIIKLLFNIERDKFSGRYKIGLSDNIIKKGVPEINRINFIARDLLIKYYTNCESTYLTGMSDVLKIRSQAISNAQAVTATTQTSNTKPTIQVNTRAAPTKANPMPGAKPTQI
jgi:hypothetical protein